MTTSHRILIGDVREQLRSLPDGSVQCCITSPPYWGLRDYGTATWEGGDPGCDHDQRRRERDESSKESGYGGQARDSLAGRDTCRKCGARRIDRQLGLEPTPEAFIATMVEVFAEVRRVLRDDGTCWLNLGDSYSRMQPDNVPQSKNVKVQPPSMRERVVDLPPKNLVGIPWRVALALQQDGWYLRSDIVWAKPNPMPESVTDRPTKAHEYVFLLAKSQRYFFDAEAVKETGSERTVLGPKPFGRKAMLNGSGTGNMAEGALYESPPSRNIRTVWTIATAPFSEAHFATFPPKLVEPMVKAGTSEKGCCPKCGAPWERVVERTKYEPDIAVVGERFVDESRGDKTRKLNGAAYNASVRVIGERWQPTCTCGTTPTPCTVLDPFAGSGTTLMVARQLGRNAIGIELNPEYAAMADRRIEKALRPGTFRDMSKDDDAPLFAGDAA